jgi:hypothetical protein
MGVDSIQSQRMQCTSNPVIAGFSSVWPFLQFKSNCPA